MRGDVHPSLEIRHRSFPDAKELREHVVSVQFTEEDYERVFAGGGVTNVVYLADPDFRKPAIERVARIVTIASTALAAGIDPILEADRNVTILAIIRMGPLCIWTKPNSSIKQVENVRNANNAIPPRLICQNRCTLRALLSCRWRLDCQGRGISPWSLVVTFLRRSG